MRLTAVAAAVVLIVVGLVIATLGKDGVVSALSSSSSAGDESSTPAAADAPSPQPKPAVPVAALDGLLLDADEVAAATNWPAAKFPTPKKSSNHLNDDTIGERCHVIDVAHSPSYKGSGYTAQRIQKIEAFTTPEHQRKDWEYLGSVAAFPTAAKATKMVESARKAWQKCADQIVTYHRSTKDGDYDITWAIGSLSIDDGVLFMPISSEGGGGWGCWHALGARNNIVIETQTCANGATKAAARGAYNAIAAKVDDA